MADPIADHRLRRAAFTLIELLIVVLVIAILTTLIASGASWLNLRSKVVQTSERINAITRGLSRVGTEDGSIALALQRRAGLGGVLLFKAGVGVRAPSPASGAYLDLSARHHFGFPWAQVNRIGSSEPDVRPAPDQLSSSVVLADLSPLRSRDLMLIAGVLPPDDPVTPDDESATAYHTDRNPRRPWNDAWGHPLVIAYGIFQPTTDDQVLEALKAYQYNRSVYLSVAAAGPTLLRPLAAGDPAGNLTALWRQANAVCQDTVERTWTRDSFGRPPWTGIRVGHRTIEGTSCRALLSAPIEVK